MSDAADRQTRSRSPESESGSVAETKKATGGETTQMATQETPMEPTQVANMEETQKVTMEATKEATMEATQKASEKSKRTVAVINKKDELKLVEFLNDNELLYNKKHKYYKDPNKREAVWYKFCTENKMDKAVCKRLF